MTPSSVRCSVVVPCSSGSGGGSPIGERMPAYQRRRKHRHRDGAIGDEPREDGDAEQCDTEDDQADVVQLEDHLLALFGTTNHSFISMPAFAERSHFSGTAIPRPWIGTPGRRVRGIDAAAGSCRAGPSSRPSDSLAASKRWELNSPKTRSGRSRSTFPTSPSRERSAILVERITELADADIADPGGLASTLEEYEMTVESVERDRDVLTLEYVNTDRDDEGNIHDVAPYWRAATQR